VERTEKSKIHFLANQIRSIKANHSLTYGIFSDKTKPVFWTKIMLRLSSPSQRGFVPYT